MSDRIRILLFCRAPAEGPEVIERAYHEISKTLADTPGLLGNELLHSLIEDDAFAVMSEWESLEAFHAWDEGPDHKDQTAGLRPYQDRTRRPWDMYAVRASY
ncbi:antibiotic biosynthesis monooxygenase family protein [Streptomyces glomeratus]|uniref:Antibiotic biosynthesis monooxygenase n=1 Tax=Streptomyces glomeratus TaxID=284452 RepID=A0ABP6L4H5_9ACTN|nr:antibiotic biosynthesis monooxygenase [Streptomyces glomeratus]MCF1509545.1 antibiotic biosynthesis monooxygenase [Streptomyces glomeratus]